jgi:adenylate cyclase
MSAAGTVGLNFHQRIHRLLEWSIVDRCILVAVIALPIAAWYALAARFVLLHPETFPWFDLPTIGLATKLQLGFIGSWVAVIVIGVVLRRRRPDSRWLVYVTLELYFVGTLIVSSLLGLHTNNLVPIILLAGAAVGAMLFEPRPVLLGMTSFVCVMVGMTVAEQTRLIRYAPVLGAAPYRDGHLDGWWLASAGTINFFTLLLLAALIYFVVDRWRDREAQLAQTSDQLARANDLISRYVATQVAQQILAGNYGAVERHERRRLTLFFSDIKGFTEVADNIEAEDLSRILNEYLSEMTGIAERYEATVDKFVGDAIMIFFGAPMATHDRDHALRAVRMAIEMQGRLEELRTKWLQEGIEEPFQIRIGINTGVASVGNFGSRGRMDYTAIGRQVTRAPRLQVNCDPGKIQLSHSTWSLVQDEIPCISKGEIHVKGFHQPVKAYEVQT